MNFGVIFTLFFITPISKTDKILVVSPIPVKSHVILNHALVNVLLSAGYEVTHITAVPRKKLPPNLRQIDVSSTRVRGNLKDVQSFSKKAIDSGGDKHIKQFAVKVFTKVLQHNSVNKLLMDTTETFDLIISEWLFNDMYTGLAALYDCPYIWFSTTEPHWMLQRTVDKNSMSRSLIKDIYERGSFVKVFSPLMALRGKPMRSYDDLMSVASLVLVNSLNELATVVPWMDKYVPIAGFHINKHIKPLHKNLKSLMDNSKHGVIYFSLGAHAESEEIPEEYIHDLVDLFGRLKQTVLWKFDMSFLHLPSNVHVLRWAPQQSILAHPNCLLFITQGGILSKIESIHFGVPTIGVPMYGDQFVNVEGSVMLGIAGKVDMSVSFVNDLETAILVMLRDPSYRQNIKEISNVYHNRTTPPRDEILKWVNHTIRTQQLGTSKLDGYKEIYVTTFVIVILSVTFAAKQILKNPHKKKHKIR